MDKVPVKSCRLEDHPQYGVVVDDPKWGHGLFSVHVAKVDAVRNVNITGGVLVPIDWINGKMIEPPLSRSIRARHEQLADDDSEAD